MSEDLDLHLHLHLHLGFGCAALLTAVLPPPIFGKRKCCWGRCWGVAIEQPAVKQSGASVRRAHSSAVYSRCIYVCVHCVCGMSRVRLCCVALAVLRSTKWSCSLR